MEKTTLSIFECKPGMKIAQTIHNSFGAVMIVEDTILDRQILNRIESMGILEIEVYEDNTETIKENRSINIHSKYEQNVMDTRPALVNL